MKPDVQTLTAWLLTALLVVATAFGAWVVAGDSGQGVLAVIDQLEAGSRQRPLVTALVFTGVFALTTAATLPTATVLCIASGYLFGTLAGSLISMCGAVGGALITFVGVRFVAGERVRDFLSRGRARRLVRLLERDAFFYLLLFRIVPIAPFFAINAAGAMIRIPARRYAAATALGLAPITLIYAAVGSGLETLVDAGRIGGPMLLLQPRIVLPLAALAGLLIAGLIVRKRLIRRRNRQPG